MKRRNVLALLCGAPVAATLPVAAMEASGEAVGKVGAEAIELEFVEIEDMGGWPYDDGGLCPVDLTPDGWHHLTADGIREEAERLERLRLGGTR